jgi:ribonuclease Z
MDKLSPQENQVVRSPNTDVKQPLMWTFPIQVAPWTLHGYSRAADATAFAIPELEFAFDAGTMVHGKRPQHVFITHTHTDHVHWLTHMKSRRKSPMVYVPKSAFLLVQDYLNAAQALTDNAVMDPNRPWERSYTLVGVEDGQVILIKRGNKSFEVHVIECCHSVPCMGYAIYEIRSKLKNEYQHLSGNEIGKLRGQGVAVAEEQRVPMFALLGDTTVEVLEQHSELVNFPVLLVECTFLDNERHASAAERTKHMLWTDLKPWIVAHPNTHFLLTHFSWRYTSKEIHDFFDQQSLPNFTVWLGRDD